MNIESSIIAEVDSEPFSSPQKWSCSDKLFHMMMYKMQHLFLKYFFSFQIVRGKRLQIITVTQIDVLHSALKQL
ncbi:hypothetical protein Ahia01_001014700 [Argonauta hians]